MIIGTCELELHLPEANSLKGKRSVIKSMLSRMRNTFNVSAAEIDRQDVWQSAVIGIVTVTNSSIHADESLTHVINWIEGNYPWVIIVRETREIIT
ncbi:MAG TPA: DUF503 domain-containing protein [Spirillospora sp.]|nr:DUF503 domain-containing protein [Spirillospora sp.]